MTTCISMIPKCCYAPLHSTPALPDTVLSDASFDSHRAATWTFLQSAHMLHVSVIHTHSYKVRLATTSALSAQNAAAFACCISDCLAACSLASMLGFGKCGCVQQVESSRTGQDESGARHMQAERPANRGWQCTAASTLHHEA